MSHRPGFAALQATGCSVSFYPPPKTTPSSGTIGNRPDEGDLIKVTVSDRQSLGGTQVSAFLHRELAQPPLRN